MTIFIFILCVVNKDYVQVWLKSLKNYIYVYVYTYIYTILQQCVHTFCSHISSLITNVTFEHQTVSSLSHRRTKDVNSPLYQPRYLQGSPRERKKTRTGNPTRLVIIHVRKPTE